MDANRINGVQNGPHPVRIRIPVQSELKRYIQHQKYSKILERQLSEARKELEVLQKQAIAKRQAIDQLEKLQRDEKEDRRFVQFKHPISRFSKALLREIFQLAVDESTKTGFITATYLSQVCKAWRKVAITTTTLWTLVAVSIKDDLEQTRLFIERARARVRNTPAWVIIHDIKNFPRSTLPTFKSYIEALQLNSFPAIQVLALHLESSAGLKMINPSIFKISSARIKHVIIECGDDTKKTITCDPSWMLRQDRPVRVLELNFHGTLDLEKAESFSSLDRFHLDKVSAPNLGPKFAYFKNLLMLDWSGDYEMLPLPEEAGNVIMPRLTTLRITGIRKFPWLRITAPDLIVVATDDETSLQFLCSHTSIRDLELQKRMEKDWFDPLADSLVHLESLEIVDRMDFLLVRIRSEGPFLPFPWLYHVTVRLSGDKGYKICPTELEEFITARRALEEPGDDGNMTKVFESMDFVGNFVELEEAPWRNIPLLRKRNCLQTLTVPKEEELVGSLALQWSY